MCDSVILLQYEKMNKDKFIKQRVPQSKQNVTIEATIGDGDSVVETIKNLSEYVKKSALKYQEGSEDYIYRYEDDGCFSYTQIVFTALESDEDFKARQQKSRVAAEELWVLLQKEKKDKAAENKKRELAEFERLKKKYER